MKKKPSLQRSSLIKDKPYYRILCRHCGALSKLLENVFKDFMMPHFKKHGASTEVPMRTFFELVNIPK